MTPLKWIVSEAKKLKKQYPKRFAKWTDYVAQASAIYASKHKGKSPIGKKKVGYSKLRLKADKELTKAIKNEPKTLFPYTKKQILIKAGKKHYDELNKNIHKVSGVKKKAAKKAVKKAPARSYGSHHKDTKSHNVNIRVVSGIEKISKGAKKLWLEINKKGLFNYNSEENILMFLYNEAIRKGQYKKAEYLKELLNDVKYY